MSKFVDIDINIFTVAARKKGSLERVQAALDLQVIKDSNYFCPQVEGTLQASALTGSNIGKGEVIWDSPYAKAQYYGLPNKTKDKNPNARMKWFEAAKVRSLIQWIGVAQGALDA